MDLLAALTAWMPTQRWFAGKGRAVDLRILATIEQVPGASIHLVMDDAGATPVLYQVPVIVEPNPSADLQHAIIGEVDGGMLIDAPHDPRFVVALLADAGASIERVAATRVLRGEQSNTSIVIEQTDAPPAIVKVFRTLHHGENPDVVLQTALSAAGSPYVPAVLGELSATWPDIGRESGTAHGTLAFAQAFVEGARDGWAIALEEASAGRSFEAAARELGIAVASVHGTLADALATTPAGDDAIARLTGEWAGRLALASAEVPSLAERATRIEAVAASTAAASWPALQRIHGDLHLGQVIAGADARWRIIDFEGEPLRPMAERSDPDSVARDVAGMLRSFDYAAAVGGAPAGWAEAARTAFLEGYAATATTPIPPALVAAFELDKAVYEVLYESRNRPDWVGIPLAGVDAILARAE